MMLLGEVADDHHANYSLASYESGRDPLPAVACDFVNHRLMKSCVRLFVARRLFQSKIEDWQHRLGKQFKVSGGTNLLGEPVCKLNLSVDVLLVGLASVDSQGQPELQRVHAPRPLCADGEVVRGKGSVHLRHVRRGHTERSLKQLRMRRENYAGGKWHGQPFMRINRD